MSNTFKALVLKDKLDVFLASAKGEMITTDKILHDMESDLLDLLDDNGFIGRLNYYEPHLTVNINGNIYSLSADDIELMLDAKE